MPPVSCVCHLRPATARGRDTRHISHHLHDITPDTDTQGFLFTRLWVIIHTQLQEYNSPFLFLYGYSL